MIKTIYVTRLSEYKKLKSQLTENVGCEDNIFETSNNDYIIESMENILKELPINIVNLIRLNLI